MNQQPMSFLEYMKRYLYYLVKWFVLALLIGSVCGLIGALFYNGIVLVNVLRADHPWLLFLMPAAGLLIVFLYRRLGQEGVSTDHIIEAAREGHALSLKLVLSVFVGTILTHLTGGSSGREGAALQIGGSIGNRVGGLLHLDPDEMKVATMAGMAAFFSAIFGTPLTAAMFAGVTNTVIASIFLAIEVFGETGILYFAMACIVSYACSGYNGLYSSQRILYSKVRPEYINLRTNHNHLIKSSRFARMMHGEKPAEHNDNEAGGS